MLKTLPLTKISFARATFYFGLFVLIVAGLWFGWVHTLDQPQLFAAFQLVPLIGIAVDVLASLGWGLGWGKLSPTRKIVLILAALFVWRVSYFPIMVFAGWVATLGKKLTLALASIITLPIVIYPIFFSPCCSCLRVR